MNFCQTRPIGDGKAFEIVTLDSLYIMDLENRGQTTALACSDVLGFGGCTTASD